MAARLRGSCLGGLGGLGFEGGQRLGMVGIARRDESPDPPVGARAGSRRRPGTGSVDRDLFVDRELRLAALGAEPQVPSVAKRLDGGSLGGTNLLEQLPQQGVTGGDRTGERRRQVRGVALGADAAVVEIGRSDSQDNALGLARAASPAPSSDASVRASGASVPASGSSTSASG